MAAKSPDEAQAKFEKIKQPFKIADRICKTIDRIWLVGAIAFVVTRVLETIARVTDKPAWLTLALAVLAALAGPSSLAGCLWAKIKRVTKGLNFTAVVAGKTVKIFREMAGEEDAECDPNSNSPSGASPSA